MLALEVLLARVERLGYHAFLGADLRHRTPALRLDEDLGFLALVRADLTAIEVVGAQIPLAVPAVLLHSLDHRVDSLLHALCLFSLANLLAEGDIVLACDDEKTCNHEALGLGALRDVLCGLERLVRIPREAVEVEAVVPVGTSDEWQHVRTEVLDDVIHRNLEVLEEGYL